MKGKAKITVVGVGNVGYAAAVYLAERRLGDLVLVDVVPNLPKGKALDLLQAMPIQDADVTIVGSNGYEETAGSDVAVVIAGIPRKPGMTREQLIDTNAGIVRGVVEQVVKHSPQTTLLIVTNPLDAMTYLAAKTSGLPRNRVVGQSGALDSTRFRTFLAMELGVSVQDVHAIVVGAHTDKDMVPLPRFSSAGGVPISSLLSKERIDAVIARTRRGGAEITELMGTSAYVAPGAAIAQMVQAIVRDEKRVLPCSALLDGEYGEKDVAIGVPVTLGAGGVEKIHELPLDATEKAAFTSSVAAIRDALNVLKV